MEKSQGLKGIEHRYWDPPGLLPVQSSGSDHLCSFGQVVPPPPPASRLGLYPGDFSTRSRMTWLEGGDRFHFQVWWTGNWGGDPWLRLPFY